MRGGRQIARFPATFVISILILPNIPLTYMGLQKSILLFIIVQKNTFLGKKLILFYTLRYIMDILVRNYLIVGRDS